MKNIYPLFFLSLVLTLTVFSCVKDEANSGTQALLDEWFPSQYKVLAGGNPAAKADTLTLVHIQTKNNPTLKFTLDYYPKQKNGGLRKDAVQKAVKAAQINTKPAQALLDILYKNGLKNVVVGTHMPENTVNIQLYEEPFTSIFSSRIKQIQKLSTEWASQQNMAPCKLTLLVMDPKAWGQRFTTIIDARYVNRADDWTYQHTIAEASADVADPGGADFLPGSLRLGGNQEMEIRKKAHAQVSDFLQTSKKMDFHVELQGMVNTEWDLRSMDKIRYTFPYCKKTKDTDQNGGCMGNFAGRISCVYTFKTREMVVDMK